MATKDISKDELFSLSKSELHKLALSEGIDPKSLTKNEILKALLDKLFPSETETKKVGKLTGISDDENIVLADTFLDTVSDHANDNVLPDSMLQLKLAEIELQRFQLQIKAEESEKERRLKFELQQQQLDFERDKLAHEVQMQTLTTSNPIATPNFRVDLACKLLPKFTPECIEEYFTAFDRVAELNGWPLNQLSGILQSQVTGKGLKVFSELTLEDARDYQRVKKAILECYQLTPQTYRSRFRDVDRQSNETYSDYAFRLKSLFKRWLEGEQVYDNLEALRETMLIEQFTEKIPVDVKLWLVDQKPKTLSKAATLADEYTAIRKPFKTKSNNEDSTKSINSNFRQSYNSRKQTGFSSYAKTRADDTRHNKSDTKSYAKTNDQKIHSSNSSSQKDVELGLCFYCHKPNHTSKMCYTKKYDMAKNRTGSSVNLVNSINHTNRCVNISTMTDFDTDRSCTLASDACETDVIEVDSVHPLFKPYCSKANVIGLNGSKNEINVLRDSGALQSLLLKSSVPDDSLTHTGETRLIQGVGGQVTEVPLVSINLESDLFSGSILCGLISVLPPGVDFLLANDIWFNIHQISDDQYFDYVITRSMTKMQPTGIHKDKPTDIQTDHEKELKIDSQTIGAQLTDSVDDISLNRLFRSTSKRAKLISTTDSMINDSSDFTTLTSNVPDLTVLNINSKDELIKLQMADKKLQRLHKQVVSKPYPESRDYFYVDGGLLMHHCFDKKRLKHMHRIVVPQLLKHKLLYLAHDIPAAGHLGKAKTRDRLIPHFYWHKMVKDITAYCKSCDTCQHVGKGSNPRVAPLIPLPVLSEPFSRISIDIVGPLPKCKNSDNRFILTVMDMATHYPEAIPLKDHKADTVAKALTTVFSHFGFAQEIQSDRGTDFMSELMKVFLEEFNIKHIKSSALHPQSQGQIERFHRTLKSMLRALGDKFDNAWDEALPWVLFSYRECPVETLGFSPFELLYTYPIRGPLSLIKRVWSDSNPEFTSTKPNVISFMLETRERLRISRELAKENADAARSISKVWYDKKARLRTFEPGQMVLALLPRPGKPLEAKWKGPFKVLERIGNVDYIISTPTKRKLTRLCHVNMLKSYVDRDWDHDVVSNCLVFDPSPLTDVQHPEFGPSPSTGEDKFDLDHLENDKKTELIELLDSFSGLFNDLPGKTSLIEHHIELQPGTKPIKLPPYRANPAKMAVIRKELEDMKAMGVIEDSNSPWASPILLVPKPDGSIRFVIDYRKVNSVTVPDAFPLPRVDDLIDKVGNAKYISKIDISKAYWQCPLSSESVPISAFVTPFGLFQWKYMSFGLRNAPATFSKLVEKLLYGLDSFTGAYLDDIIIFSDSWEDHMRHLQLVFQRIQDAGLTIKRSKCAFASAEVEYLGHIVGLNSVQPRKAKVEAILSFPRPQDCKQLRQFLGISNYYRRYIPHMAQLSVVLTDMLRKGRTFVWNEEREKAFIEIKSRLASQPILRPPNFSLPFSLAVDASDRAIGAVLLQEVDGLEHPICYYSKRLNIHQQRYSTVEKECLALVSAVRTFSVYFGTQPTTVYTDHSPLQFLQKMANYNQKLLRWSIELQQYNLVIKHRPGSKNILPDLLSRPSE